MRVKSQGISILEVLIVFSIVTLVIGVAGLSHSERLWRGRTAEIPEQFEQKLQQSRLRAMAAAEIVVVPVAEMMPAGFILCSAGDREFISFFPDGTVQAKAVCLISKNGEQYHFSVDWLTGDIGDLK